MNHASAERGDLLERRLHMVHGEIRQRGRFAWASATFVNAEHRSPAHCLPTATFDVAALVELDAEEPRPEPTRAVGIISRELDEAERLRRTR
jgi:hypothetical protein